MSTAYVVSGGLVPTVAAGSGVQTRIDSAGPTTIAPLTSLVTVDTAALAAPSVVLLSSLSPLGFEVAIADATADAENFPITVTAPAGMTVNNGASIDITSDSGALILRRESATNWIVVGGYAGSSSGNDEWEYSVLADDITSATTVLADTGVELLAEAGVQYEFFVLVNYSVVSLSTSPRYVLDGPALDYFVSDSRQAASATTFEQRPNNAFNLPAAISANSPFTVGNIMTVRGMLQTSAGGLVKLRFATEISAPNTTTTKAGSFMRWRPVPQP